MRFLGFNLLDARQNVQILQYIPKPEADLEDMGGYYAVKGTISWQFRNDSSAIQHVWERLYWRMVDGLARQMIGRDEYFITKMKPLLSYENPMTLDVEIMLVCELWKAETRQVVIPDITYKTIENKPVPIEWRCGYCSTPNFMKERLCTQCGAPRALLAQEY